MLCATDIDLRIAVIMTSITLWRQSNACFRECGRPAWYLTDQQLWAVLENLKKAGSWQSRRWRSVAASLQPYCLLQRVFRNEPQLVAFNY